MMGSVVDVGGPAATPIQPAPALAPTPVNGKDLMEDDNRFQPITNLDALDLSPTVQPSASVQPAVDLEGLWEMNRTNFIEERRRGWLSKTSGFSKKRRWFILSKTTDGGFLDYCESPAIISFRLPNLPPA